MMALQSLYKDEKFSDLTVSCGPEGKSRTFKLHRAVICPQSPFFDKACTSGFQVSSANSSLAIFATGLPVRLKIK